MRTPGTALRQRGASLLEVAVVVIVITILAGVLLQRLGVVRQQAELAAVRQVLAYVQAEMNLMAARTRTQSVDADWKKLADENPMNWLANKPANYLGEYFGDPDQSNHRSGWYFDRKQHHLVYLLNSGDKFPGGTVKTFRYRVILLGLTKHFVKPTGNAATGLALEQVDGFNAVP